MLFFWLGFFWAMAAWASSASGQAAARAILLAGGGCSSGQGTANLLGRQARAWRTGTSEASEGGDWRVSKVSSLDGEAATKRGEVNVDRVEQSGPKEADGHIRWGRAKSGALAKAKAGAIANGNEGTSVDERGESEMRAMPSEAARRGKMMTKELMCEEDSGEQRGKIVEVEESSQYYHGRPFESHPRQESGGHRIQPTVPSEREACPVVDNGIRGDTVLKVVLDVRVDNLDDGDHPFHLHGHRPWMYVTSSDLDVFLTGSRSRRMGIGPGRYIGQALNATSPLRRDTILIPAYNWVVLRFITDNPGLWAFHCHLAWHMAAGLLMQFNSLPSALAKLDVPQDIAQCTKR
ncbi:multicopper oxidase-domain-containing protein [Lactarius pseudohatsudake]|nr:multicopper oxidase-domain-containing protein [Lactarius pseudohatsudake]